MYSTIPRIRQTSRRTAITLIAAFICAATGLLNINAAIPPNRVNVVPRITGITVENGQLVASGTVSATLHGRTTTVPFRVPVNLDLAPDQTGAGTCPILNLELAPIHLNLLGLVVDTSSICLDITAIEGGGLLGDLLCDVAGLLDGGLNLGQILGGQGIGGLPGLTPTQVTNLLGGLRMLLNQTLANLINAVVTDILDGGPRACDILHLELGPLELNLLGLLVELDDCEGGPVVVDITGQRGRGNLLGNLLCGLLGSGRAGIGSTLGGIANQLGR